jgi:hypothetical protein
VNSRILYENLDTSFVNLWALLRYLMQRGVVGRVHVELPDYTADAFLNGSTTPMVHEVDQATGRDSLEEAALHRLVVRAREPGGTITVYEGAEEAAKGGAQKPAPESATVAGGFAPPDVYEVNAVDETVDAMRPAPLPNPPILESAGSKLITAVQKSIPAKGGDWLALVEISGELIAAIESAATGVGADFAAVFNATRLELADDYTFLDPSANRFSYADRVVKINAKPGAGPYVAAIGELLRRAVDKIAVGERGGRIRERVALELAKLARKRREPLTQFNLDMQLDRIAGTRVL